MKGNPIATAGILGLRAFHHKESLETWEAYATEVDKKFDSKDSENGDHRDPADNQTMALVALGCEACEESPFHWSSCH